MACQHCDNAACQRVCPTGATYKDEKGRVEIDYDKCIGCRMCMAACPYNARVFNWSKPERSTGANWGDGRVPVRPKGVAEKCTLCKERTDDGDLDDPDSEISKVIRENQAYVLLEEQGTQPKVHYFN